MREQWQLHCTSQCERWTPLSKHMYCVAIAFKMTEWVEPQICIRFCIKPDYSSIETPRMTQKAFGDNAMSSVQIKVWYIRFKDGWESVESHPRSERPAPSRAPESVEQVGAATNEDWRPRWLSLATAQMWCPETSGLSQNWNHPWKGRDFRSLMRIRKIWWGRWWQFQQRILQSVLNNRRDAGRTAWGPKVPTLKGSEASSYVQCSLYIIF